VRSRRGTVAGTQFGVYAVEPAASCLLSTAYKPAEARHKWPQAVNRRLVEEAARAPGLERRLCRLRRDARGDLRPAASGKAQPREAPLEVVVVQLQQSQPASLAV